MSAALTSSNALGVDARSLNALKLQAGQATPAAIKETARQFESLFMAELIKSMRQATMKSGLADSGGSDLGTELLDQQLALQMAGQPGGLSDIIARQLSRQMGVSEASTAASLQTGDALRGTGSSAPQAARTPPAGYVPANATQMSFVQRHAAEAARVSQTSGLPSAYMLGQAGHETGWGRHEIKMSDGTPSYNLFGIKATPGWTGKVAEVTTTEYVNGVSQKVVAKFRAYDSYEDSFRDYARLITQSPRYQQASLQTGSPQAFASGLQRAGYATDPQYAAKLSRAINATLRMQRVQA
jgi:flagellar protein FlgJ